VSTDAQLISVRTHPRARAAIRRMKGWAGMAGFVLTVLLSLRADVPMVVAELEAYKIEINRSHSPDDVR
jgi:hypothetical protein